MVKSLKRYEGKDTTLTVADNTTYHGRVIKENPYENGFEKPDRREVYFFKTRGGKKIRITAPDVTTTKEGGLVLKVKDSALKK